MRLGEWGDRLGAIAKKGQTIAKIRPDSRSKRYLLHSIRKVMEHSQEGYKEGIDYEGTWDAYAKAWQNLHPDLKHIGDEWIGQGAGAAQSLAEYEALIEQKFIASYIKPNEKVLEIGIGGGKTSALLLKHCQELVCADISREMLDATRSRLGEDRISYVKLDGISLDPIPDASIDVCFCYDTMVHLEPRDIFNYLTQIPRKLRGDRRLCVFHHTNILSELGWKKFASEWQFNLMGKRHGSSFSVMTDNIMEQFLTRLDYQIILKDHQSVPRDCVWICQAPKTVTLPE